MFSYTWSLYQVEREGKKKVERDELGKRTHRRDKLSKEVNRNGYDQRTGGVYL